MFSAIIAATLRPRTDEGQLCATTVTTIHYLAAKSVGAAKARQHIRELLALCAVAPVHRTVLVPEECARILKQQERDSGS